MVYKVPDNDNEHKFKNIVITPLVFNEPRYNDHLKNKFFSDFLFIFRVF